jgi:hypothetical protein
MTARIRKTGPRSNVDLVTLAQNHGGFSVKEGSGRHGPPGAYAAWQGQEKVISGAMTSNDVRSFRSEHADRLAGPNAYLGGYREPEGVRQKSPQREGDTTYLDVSRRFVGPTRVERALEFGRKQGQVSVYDTDSGLHYSHSNPAVPDDSKYEYSANMASAARTQKDARTLPPGPERAGRVEEMVDSIFAAQNLKR